MLLLGDDRIAPRRAAAAGPLAGLASSLSADLDAVIARPLYVPRDKALLSRAGGRCERDGSMLEFDPFSPESHRCPVCCTVYHGVAHHRWWIYWYQLWLAERAVHGAVLFLLRGDERYARFSRDVLHAYAEEYLRYPNRDNVLGPTRPFFSTYLESIWLLQLCVATDILVATGDASIRGHVADRIVEPSAALIAEYNEGFSNRQVWNCAALMAASLLMGRHDAAERVMRGPTGVEAMLSYGLLADGTWYEGENYHLFAHRGLWYGVTLAENAGMPVDARLTARFNEGFATPFATALPDFTFPARKDSQYGVALRQWRFAEQCELGLARHDDGRLIGALSRIYAADMPHGDTGRARSSADVERNVPASALTRDDLGWRSLLHARPALPPLAPNPPRSVNLDAQGFTVFRREAGAVYVALDWGQSGGGHGHPDRLNVLFAHDNARWLDDLGTGSYVDRSLHWYRSTLAHNAPMVNGHSQWPADGELLAYDERGGFGWILAAANIASGVSAQRALVITPDYFIDELRWSSAEPVRFELPVHFDGDLMGPSLSPAPLDGGHDADDGSEFVSDIYHASIDAHTSFALAGRRDSVVARARICSDTAGELIRATAPGQPSTSSRPFYLFRCHGTGGAIRSVWTWSPRETGVTFRDDHIVVDLGAERHEHWLTPDYWQVELSVGNARSGIELFGWRTAPDSPVPVTAPSQQRPRPVALPRGRPVSFELGEPHYRRSEESWSGAGRPGARVSVTADDSALVVDVNATVGALVMVDPGAVNPFDNEEPDINGHGVQIYVRTESGGGAWLVAPAPGQRGSRVRPIPGWGSLRLLSAHWAPTERGFSIQAAVELPPGTGPTPVALDVLVNETEPGRARRRGQLVLSGVSGEFVYLRGDRHDPDRLIDFLVE